MRLFHFSEQAGIDLFEPRPPLTLPQRPADSAWLNGPLVWAIDEAHAFLYLFPRDCPRIVAFAKPGTTAEDREAWLQGAPAVAFVEAGWMSRIGTITLWRYELPGTTFESLADAGMHVSPAAVRPIASDCVSDLPAALAESGVDLRPLPSLAPMRDLWASSLHVSGIRLRNAVGWDEPVLG